MDTLVPVLERQTSTTAARAWIDVAQTTTRDDLREKVREALGRAPRRRHRVGEQVQTFLINAMPDLESRQLATEFFDVGAVYTDTPNPVAILIAGMQEALATWQPHLSDIELRHLTGGVHDENHDDSE